jgi:hypothetical protein
VLAAVDQFIRGATVIIHQVALLYAEVRDLRTVNEALSKRRRAKKSRIRLGGSLTIQDGIDLLDQKDVDEQLRGEDRRGGGQGGQARMKAPRCGNCGKPGYNIRTCREAGEESDKSISSAIIVDN